MPNTLLVDQAGAQESDEKKKIWTYDDYLLLNDGKRYETFEGEMRIVPAPTTTHQRISREPEMIIVKFLKEHLIDGEVFDAPVDVILNDTAVLQPDLIFVSEQRKKIIRDEGIFGAPDLVVEILSEATIHDDLVRKSEFMYNLALWNIGLLTLKSNQSKFLRIRAGTLFQ